MLAVRSASLQMSRFDSSPCLHPKSPRFVLVLNEPGRPGRFYRIWPRDHPGMSNSSRSCALDGW